MLVNQWYDLLCIVINWWLRMQLFIQACLAVHHASGKHSLELVKVYGSIVRKLSQYLIVFLNWNDMYSYKILIK